MESIRLDSTESFFFHPAIDFTLKMEQGFLTLEHEGLGIYICGKDLESVCETLDEDIEYLYYKYVECSDINSTPLSDGLRDILCHIVSRKQR